MFSQFTSEPAGLRTGCQFISVGNVVKGNAALCSGVSSISLSDSLIIYRCFSSRRVVSSAAQPDASVCLYRAESASSPEPADRSNILTGPSAHTEQASLTSTQAFIVTEAVCVTAGVQVCPHKSHSNLEYISKYIH